LTSWHNFVASRTGSAANYPLVCHGRQLTTDSPSPQSERHCDEPARVPVESQANSEFEPKTQSGWTQLGWALMVVSVGVWLVFPFLSFFSLTGEQKLETAGAVFVLAEISFWGGAAMAGPDAARRMRSWWKGNEARSETQPPPSSTAKLEDSQRRDS
jgi:hypothetical protein